MYFATYWLPFAKRCHWSSTVCMTDTNISLGVSILSHLKSERLLSSKSQLLYISSILPSLINQFYFGKSDHIIPVEIIIHVWCPIEKIFESNWPSKVNAFSLMFCMFIPSLSGWTLHLGVWFLDWRLFSLTFSVISRSI